MSGNRDEEMEFISVSANDNDNDSMTAQSYGVAAPTGSAYDNVMGSWVFRQSKHPLTIFFHLLFKAAAIFIYIFGSWFTSNFIVTFVICIILLAFDFWTVKNVSGRLLVGLRWWSYVKDDGSNEWIFESLEDMAEISPMDSRIFWGAMYIVPVAWGLLFVIGLLRLKFEYMPIVIAAISMSVANIMGYLKCSSSAKAKMQSMMEQGVKQSTMSALENSSLRNWIFTSLLAVTSNAAAAPGTQPAVRV